MKLENTTFNHSRHWVGALISGLASLGSSAINAASQKDAPTDKYQTSGAINTDVDGNFIDYIINGKNTSKNWTQTLPDGSTNQIQKGVNTGYDSLDAQYLANQEDYALQNYYNNLQSKNNLKNQLSLIQDSSAAEKLGYQNAGISTANLTSGSTASALSGSVGVGSGVSAPAADAGAIANANNAQSNANNLRTVGVQALTSLANAALTARGQNMDAPVKASEAEKNTADAKNTDEDTKGKEITNRILGKQEQSLVDKASAEADLANQQYLTEQQKTTLVGLQQQTEKNLANLNDTQNKLVTKELNSFDERFYNEMQEVKSRIKVNDATTVQKYADAALAKVETLEKSLETQLIKAQIPNAAELSKAVVEETKGRIQLATEEAKQEMIRRKHDAWQSGLDENSGEIKNMPRYIIHSILEEIDGAVGACLGMAIGKGSAAYKSSVNKASLKNTSQRIGFHN